ncbi:hypothetical protein IT408_02015 [Candidatus Uhrbacteria bacterium]|nr:hypothetical protein [Candidatus Uhrbacteria bacterium]
MERFPPSGKFQTQTVLDGKNAWILPFLPAERTTAPGKQADGWIGQRILGDPVYFTARSPGPYEWVDLYVEFRPIRQSLVEIGMVRDADGKELEMQPLYSSELMSESFRAIPGKGFVRLGTPDSRLDDPKPEGLATWHATTTAEQLTDPAHQMQNYTISLRGSHDFYLIPSDGKIEWNIEFQAANRNKGNDIVVIRVFHGDEEIDRAAVSVSGSLDTRLGNKVVHRINKMDAKPGVYRIQVIASDDVFIRSIQTTSQHWVFGPRFVAGDNVGYTTTTASVRVWTNSRHIVAETFHNEGLQKIIFGDVSTNLQHTHEQMRLDRNTDLQNIVELSAPRGDIRLIADGFFAVSQEAFFEPRPLRLTDATDLRTDHVLAVRTPFVRPKDLGDGWFQGYQRFALRPGQDQLRFVLSAPGMTARAAAVDIRNISLTFSRDQNVQQSWIKIFRQELAQAWRRL